MKKTVEMFYLNTIEQLFLFVEQLDQLEVCLPYSRLLTGIQILAVFQNFRWNSNKTSLSSFNFLRYPFQILITSLLNSETNPHLSEISASNWTKCSSFFVTCLSSDKQSTAIKLSELGPILVSVSMNYQALCPMSILHASLCSVFFW